MYNYLNFPHFFPYFFYKKVLIICEKYDERLYII